jgi:hypothetical protein
MIGFFRDSGAKKRTVFPRKLNFITLPTMPVSQRVAGGHLVMAASEPKRLNQVEIDFSV